MTYLIDLYVLATSLVTVASVICNYTDTPKDDVWVAKAYKVMEQFAFLGGKAKQQVMDSVVTLINEVGFPIAAALGLGMFIWKLINRIIDGLETKVDTLDDKLLEAINHLEERLGGKLDGQHGILIALIDRVRSVDNEIIRQDVLLKTVLGVPQLLQTDRLAKADRDDQRKD